MSVVYKNPDLNVSPERRAELLVKIQELQDLSSRYYGSAVKLQVHAFIEFAGLMNEMIKIYQKSLEAGIDFTLANQHTDVPLVAMPYNLRYLQEKLECIMEPFAEVKLRPRKDE